VLSKVMIGELYPYLPADNPMNGFVRDCCRHDPTTRPTAATLASQMRAARDRAFPLAQPELHAQPERQAAARELANPHQFPPTHARVLLADDVALNSKVLEHLLHKFIGASWDVTSRSTPQAAVEAVRTMPFDLVIMDEVFSQEAGGMRGSDAVREIRRFEASQTDGHKAIIITCSGSINIGDATATFMEAGADAVWSKPYPSGDDKTLQNDLEALFSRRWREAASRAKAATPPTT